MESDQTTSTIDQAAMQMAGANVPRDFGELLRERREAARLSLSELARKAGLTRGTIRNIEANITTPSPGTMRRLVAVSALKFSPADLHAQSSQVEDKSWHPDAWFAPQYNPRQIAEEMAAMLNGPGGHIDQTYLYLDPQSASAWFKLCNGEKYSTAFRAAMPLDKVAERILRGSGAGRRRTRVR